MIRKDLGALGVGVARETGENVQFLWSDPVPVYLHVWVFDGACVANVVELCMAFESVLKGGGSVFLGNAFLLQNHRSNWLK